MRGLASVRSSRTSSGSSAFRRNASPLRMSAASQPLTSLEVGQRAVVTEIKIPAEHRGRILEMGVLVGTPVELVRFAPLGDPIEIKVRGYNLSLRKHEAEQILVRKG